MVEAIKHLGFDITWKLNQGQGHWSKIPDEIDDMLDFLKSKTNLRASA